MEEHLHATGQQSSQGDGCHAQAMLNAIVDHSAYLRVHLQAQKIKSAATAFLKPTAAGLSWTTVMSDVYVPAEIRWGRGFVATQMYALCKLYVKR